MGEGGEGRQQAGRQAGSRRILVVVGVRWLAQADRQAVALALSQAQRGGRRAAAPSTRAQRGGT